MVKGTGRKNRLGIRMELLKYFSASWENPFARSRADPPKALDEAADLRYCIPKHRYSLISAHFFPAPPVTPVAPSAGNSRRRTLLS